MIYIKLLRPKDWIKNLFIFLPLFFAGESFNLQKNISLMLGLISFSCIASGIYILNDCRDAADDRKHPDKCKRPIASGRASMPKAMIIFSLLVSLGFVLSWWLNHNFFLILAGYFMMNLGYSLGLKRIPILDILILSTGFVLRIMAGSVIGGVFLSEWIIIMVFLLALFLVVGKRRDDVLLKLSSGVDMRQSLQGYNLELLNILLGVLCGVIIVAYLMYTVSPDAIARLGTSRLYYTCLFVVAGIMRYLQVIFVANNSGSPTDILYKDRFLQVTLLLWVTSFIVIIYLKDVSIQLTMNS